MTKTFAATVRASASDAPGGSCTATITYYPTNSGSDSGTFTMTSTAPNSPHVVSLNAGTVLQASTSASTNPLARGDEVTFLFPGREGRR